MKRIVGADGVAYVWHWANCEKCGEHVNVREDGIDSFRVAPGCCSGNGARRSAAFTHAAADIIRRPLLCGTCGYQKKFGAPPASGEEHATMAKSKKTAKASGGSKGKANGKAQRSLPTRSADGAERVERRHFHQRLPCRIEAESVQGKAEELAKVIGERLLVKEERREANARYREQIQFYDEREKELAASVRGRTEARSVECVVYLLPTNEVEIIRLDTGEVVEKRTASPEELQLELPETDDEASAGEEPEPPFGEPGQAPAPKGRGKARGNGSAETLEATP